MLFSENSRIREVSRISGAGDSSEVYIYSGVQIYKCTDVQVVGCSGMQARRCGCATYDVIREELIYSSQCQASHVASHILEWKVTRNCLGTDC